ncbi:MAG TPA: Xaa-Pro peptidase family protein [Gaiellaceae bacterium]|nr:Xaa-Pro peptidase family protein [Gaiellaceae bacterium]
MTAVDRLRGLIDEPLLVTMPVNVFYLTGFQSSNAALLVDDERAVLFSDFRYAEGARKVEGVEFVEVERALIRGVAAHVEGRLAFERSHLTYASWEVLSDAGVDLVPGGGQVERLRAVKSERELELIRRATDITNEAYLRLAEEPFVGRTERELAFRFATFIHECGGHGEAFSTTVASGPNGAIPHARTSDRVVEKGETVVVDAGAVLDGYASDCTRTFATGPLPDELRRAYDVVLEAQLEGLDAVRPGATGREADAAARDVIAGAGLGERFGHGLGHGVGLMVHEAPTLRPESQDTLEPNNVVTVEPGVYLPGVGGIRIEDLVVVREGEPVVLTSFPKELVTVG